MNSREGHEKDKIGQRGCMSVYRQGEVVHVSLGPLGDPESEHVVSIHQSLVPTLIAALRLSEGS